MISAKRFALSEPELFKASRDFILSFAEVPDPVVFISSKAKTLHSKISWTLLGSALFQDIHYENMVRLLCALYKAYPEERLWTIPVPKEEELLEVTDQVMPGISWNLRESLPGIFWSVGNFVRHHHSDLVLWVSERNAEEIWRDLGEIYFMGKGKSRPKAIATIYRLTEKAPRGLGIALKPSHKKTPLPLSMGMRRYMSILGPGKYVKFSELDAEEKQKVAHQMYEELTPENPAIAAHGLQFFLEKKSMEFICRDHFKTCDKCPLYKFCRHAL
ncbi:MAG: hypothetical protein HUK20_00130 [Fibrobacter sp.]|nr:hypothetical protein [Fibrobacter sp.]